MQLVDAGCNEPCPGGSGLAVAHGCFWRYHPARAYQWELRLQDEIRPDFTLDEIGSDAARAAFEAEHPEKVEELVAKDHQRRLRKQAKVGQAEAVDDDPQGDLDLGDSDEAEAEADEELSAGRMTACTSGRTDPPAAGGTGRAYRLHGDVRWSLGIRTDSADVVCRIRRREITSARWHGDPGAISEPLPPRAVRASRRRFERAAKRPRDRPDTLRLRASWGARRLELAAAGAPAIVVALVTAVAFAMTVWLRWFR